MSVISFATISHSAGTSAAQFLKLGAGARAAAMGNAFASVADDVTATYWNPAGLSQITSPEISLMENSWLMDSQYQFVGGGMPVGNSAVGFSVQRVSYGTMDRYTADNVKEGSFDAGSLAGGLTYAGKWNDRIRFGLTGKFVQESIESESASTFAGDAGVLVQGGIFNFGLTVQNIGPGLKFVEERSPLPQLIRLGVSAKFFEEKLLVSLEGVMPNDNDPTFQTGLEYKAAPILCLRTGYKITPGNRLDVKGLTDISGGFGLNLGIFTLDYAFLPFGDLGNSHQISLLVKFK